jgi:hypothetical protein
VTLPAAPRPAWLILSYRLAARPGLKTTVRRRLTAIGAVFPVNAVAAVPASPAAERAVRRLCRTIGNAGGSAQMLRAEVIEGAPDLVAAFNAARDEEYAGIMAECGEVIVGIETLTTDDRFRYADLGEKDAELKRLSLRNNTIRARDIFGAANAEAAASALARCRMVLDGFAARVYQEDAASVTGVIPGPRSPHALSRKTTAEGLAVNAESPPTVPAEHDRGLVRHAWFLRGRLLPARWLSSGTSRCSRALPAGLARCACARAHRSPIRLPAVVHLPDRPHHR